MKVGGVYLKYPVANPPAYFKMKHMKNISLSDVDARDKNDWR